MSRSGERDWLTIPVRQRALGQGFMETEIADARWAQKHFNTLRHTLGRSIHWRTFQSQIEALYEKAAEMKFLYEVNRLFLEWVAATLGVRSKLVFLSEYAHDDDPSRRLVSILKDHGATDYLSGPAASAYLNEQYFADAGIKVDYVDYSKLIVEQTGQPRPEVAVSTIQTIIEENHGFSSHRSQSARARSAA